MAGSVGLITKISRPLVQLTNKGIRFFAKNSNLVLTIVGATGVITTAILAIKGTIKAVKLCEEKQVYGAKEIIKTVWKCYIPTVGVVILTTAAILYNGKINAKKIAVLTSAYSGATEALKKVEEKMTEQIGPKKTQKAIDEAEGAMAQQQAPQRQTDIIATGQGKQLFFCATTGQWFYSDWNGVQLAEQKFQKVFEKQCSSWGAREVVLLSEAQEALGLPVTDMGEYMGWLTDDFLDTNDAVHFTVSSDWMDLPWGRETVGIVRLTPWPINI